ncbi:hypothetical protein ACSRUE_01450 [Sorangium sp. KYC3313]|uniref:hypothetical protein n=1 Tax=Sorangium sp. KYC3313 TaxID=3449740 RepID=UPI003F8B76F0
MAAIDWAPTIAALDAEITTATGPTKEIGKGIRGTLYRLGQEYDARFSVQVSAAKDAFAALVTAAHEEADRTCRYAESLVGTAGPALPVDLYSNAAILARCDSALRTAADNILKRTLSANRANVVVVYLSGNPNGGTSWYMSFLGTEAHPYSRSYSLSVRALELEMMVQISAANDWIAVAQYS